MRKKPRPGKQKVMRFDKELAERLERYTADTGVTQVRVQTEALNAYLTVKGY